VLLLLLLLLLFVVPPPSFLLSPYPFVCMCVACSADLLPPQNILILISRERYQYGVVRGGEPLVFLFIFWLYLLVCICVVRAREGDENSPPPHQFLGCFGLRVRELNFPPFSLAFKERV
jgi:hypothetical protein